MAHIVILGAGLSGTIMAYELAEQIGKDDRITVVTRDAHYHFVPSNPWIALGWRKRGDISIDLAPVMKDKGIVFRTVAAEKVHPAENRLDLADGTGLSYDYLIVASGPELAFDEIEGLGPETGFTQSICHVDHAETANAAFEAFCKAPGPIVIGAVQGASCFGPAYEYCLMLDTELRRRKLRDKVPMTFVTPEPYIGHLGLDGVGDTKSLLESKFRDHHIKWLTNARVKKCEPGKIIVEQVGEGGVAGAPIEVPAAFSMLLPAFRGIKPVFGIEGLSNPRGFTLIDKHQRNPKYPNVFAVGVTVAIPPIGPTPVPCGVPKTGFMIESMVTATARNIGQLLKGQEPDNVATWNAVCLADFGDGGVAFVAQPQIPPRNVNWASDGKWVHTAKVGFEKYFMRKMKQGVSETFYEKIALKMLGIEKLTEVTKG